MESPSLKDGVDAHSCFDSPRKDDFSDKRHGKSPDFKQFSKSKEKGQINLIEVTEKSERNEAGDTSRLGNERPSPRRSPRVTFPDERGKNLRTDLTTRLVSADQLGEPEEEEKGNASQYSPAWSGYGEQPPRQRSRTQDLKAKPGQRKLKKVETADLEKTSNKQEFLKYQTARDYHEHKDQKIERLRRGSSNTSQQKIRSDMKLKKTQTIMMDKHDRPQSVMSDSLSHSTNMGKITQNMKAQMKSQRFNFSKNQFTSRILIEQQIQSKMKKGIGSIIIGEQSKVARKSTRNLMNPDEGIGGNHLSPNLKKAHPYHSQYTVKNNLNEDVDISKISDTQIMQQLLQEKIHLNIAKLINIQQGAQKRQMEDEVSLSSERLWRLKEKYKETEKLLKLQQETVPLDQKLMLITGLKVKEIDKVYGITPNDFQIYLQLDKIDRFGNQKSIQEIFQEDEKRRFEQLRDIDPDFDSIDSTSKELTLDEKIDRAFSKCMDKLIIRRSNKIFQAHQFFITISSLFSCYFYMYLAAFGISNSLVYQMFEIYFFFDMILQFFVEYTPDDGKNIAVRNFSKIATNFVKTDMIYMLIPLIPFQFLKLPLDMQNLFWLLKTTRLLNGLKLLNVHKITTWLKKYYQERLQQRVLENPSIAEDTSVDNNKQLRIVAISLALKTVKLVILIINFSYFIGMGWLILCKTVQSIYFQEQGPPPDLHEDSYFLTKFEILQMDEFKQAIVAVYFAFTSLSTVGFGDYHPRSNLERMINAFILLFGVAVFSFIMGKFIEMIHSIKEFNQSLDAGDQLSRFFGVIYRFNNNNPVNTDLKNRIEDHFKYKWEHDKNQALRMNEDLEIFFQIPEEIQDSIYHKFLFSIFLKDFKKYFSFEKKLSLIKCNFYSWRDNVYREFMTEMLSSLEPRRELKNTILIDELDEFTEILFFNKGQIDIGYDINRKRHFVLRITKSIIVGDHGCTFNNKANFIYKVHQTCEGFSIRKHQWAKILDKNEEIAQQLKLRIIQTYFYQIKLKVLKEKNQEIRKLIRRADVHHLLSLSNIDNNGEGRFLQQSLGQLDYDKIHHLLIKKKKMMRQHQSSMRQDSSSRALNRIKNGDNLSVPGNDTSRADSVSQSVSKKLRESFNIEKSSELSFNSEEFKNDENDRIITKLTGNVNEDIEEKIQKGVEYVQSLQEWQDAFSDQIGDLQHDNAMLINQNEVLKIENQSMKTELHLLKARLAHMQIRNTCPKCTQFDVTTPKASTNFHRNSTVLNPNLLGLEHKNDVSRSKTFAYGHLNAPSAFKDFKDSDSWAKQSPAGMDESRLKNAPDGNESALWKQADLQLRSARRALEQEKDLAEGGEATLAFNGIKDMREAANLVSPLGANSRDKDTLGVLIEEVKLRDIMNDNAEGLSRPGSKQNPTPISASQLFPAGAEHNIASASSPNLELGQLGQLGQLGPLAGSKESPRQKPQSSQGPAKNLKRSSQSRRSSSNMPQSLMKSPYIGSKKLKTKFKGYNFIPNSEDCFEIKSGI